MAYDVFRLLLESKIGVVFLTKGRIPERHRELLSAHPRLVQGRIGLVTLDPAIAAAFEPCAATPEERLAEAAELIRAKVPVEARLDPILPGVTDGAECLEPLCAALARVGVRRLSASVLFLRPAVAASLRRHVQDKVMLDRLLSSFAAGKPLAIHAGRSRVRAIPACERRKIFERLKSIARRHGIEVCVCACKNPDIPATSCHVPVRWRHAVDRGSQLLLFQT